MNTADVSQFVIIINEGLFFFFLEKGAMTFPNWYKCTHLANASSPYCCPMHLTRANNKTPKKSCQNACPLLPQRPRENTAAKHLLGCNVSAQSPCLSQRRFQLFACSRRILGPRCVGYFLRIPGNFHPRVEAAFLCMKFC